MTLFAAGMFTGAFITLVIAMAFAARNGDDRARKLREFQKHRESVNRRGGW